MTDASTPATGGRATGPPTEVAAANVSSTLGRADARSALHLVLGLAPDLVALQEWPLTRLGLLRESGTATTVPPLWPGPRRRDPVARDGYVWSAPVVGGCAVGARSDRYDLLGVRLRLLSRPGLGDRSPGRRTLEPGRVATVATYRDRLLGRTDTLIGFHLVWGVQAGGRYRADRPLLVARHRQEVRVLQRLVDEQLARGHVVHAAGDSNLDGLRLRGLTSAWAGRPADPGTLGPRRKVDDVHGPGPALDVRRVTTASDHVAIVVRRGGGG
jgi:hypothetical protein